MLKYGGHFKILDLFNLSLKDTKIVDTLSRLQVLYLEEVNLLDDDALPLEACIQLEELRLKRKNVQTISGIGGPRHTTLRTLDLCYMKNLRYLPDCPGKVTTLDWFRIVGCEKYDTSLIEERLGIRNLNNEQTLLLCH